jgi:cytochrome P450
MTGATILFDPSDPELRCDPYPTYRRMREEAPCWLSPEGIWYFTRYADCFTLLRTPALSHDTTRSTSFERRLSSDPVERQRQLEESRRSRSLLETDPPDHTRLRSLINRAFTAPTVEAGRPMVIDFVDNLIDDFDGPSVDLVSQFSSVLPIFVICGMMNVPTGERQELLDLGYALGRAVDADVSVDERIEANRRMQAYVAGLLDRRRQNPGDDLITRLIAAADDGRLVDENELQINTGVLLIAGFETTTNLISNVVYRLLEHPEQLQQLRADPSLIGTTIEEVLRFDPLSQFLMPRTIVDDIEIGGVALHPGDPVVPVLAAANRDPAEFADPETFDITRTVNRHLGFGVGPHRCIGAPLARMEAQIAVLRLVQRFPDLALSTTADPEYRPNLRLRGFAKLPVTI